MCTQANKPTERQTHKTRPLPCPVPLCLSVCRCVSVRTFLLLICAYIPPNPVTSLLFFSLPLFDYNSRTCLYSDLCRLSVFSVSLLFPSSSLTVSQSFSQFCLSFAGRFGALRVHYWVPGFFIACLFLASLLFLPLLGVFSLLLCESWLGILCLFHSSFSLYFHFGLH